MIVSKRRIEEVIEVMCMPLVEKMSEINSEMNKKATEFALEKFIPNDVKDFFAKYPNAMIIEGTKYYAEPGCYKSVYITFKCPNLDSFVDLKESVENTKEFIDLISPLFKEYQELAKKQNSLSGKLRCVLPTLKTYNKIKKELPEVYKVLVSLDSEEDKLSMCDSVESVQAEIVSVQEFIKEEPVKK